ncbi:MAG: Gfo/Idh/MocA family oxidoreductase [Bryobacterales bacterium]|nr:Gfo/Idh/MocA family oxidoreductase [Bryobacterales bacterium]
MTRRDFASLTTATLGLASPSASAQGAPAPAGSLRKVRAAMIGTGHGHAGSKVRALSTMPEYDFLGVCRPDESDPITGNGFRSVRWVKLPEILDDPSIEMVAIEGADAEWNLDYAWRCVNAGKFVHLDKPPGASYSGLRDLLAEAERRKRIVQMGFQWRYHPGMRLALEAARNGWLGRVYRVRASIDKPILADERRHLAKYKGGMMFSEGCHLVDQATAFLGEPAKVSGFMHHHSPLNDGLIDNALVVLEYPEAMAEVSLAGFDPNGGKHRYVEVLGTNGLARIEPFEPLRLQVKLKQAAGPYQAGDQTLEPLDAAGYPYAADFRELYQAIREGAAPRFSAKHDLFTHRVLLEACGML